MRCRVTRSAPVFATLVPPGEVIMAIFRNDINHQVVTFSWVSRGVPLGSTTFRVQCSSTIVTPVQVRARTLTIDVYKP
jgi:hypothetical protein